MKYIMRNKKYGLKVTAPSEACRDNIIASSKNKDGVDMWECIEQIADDPRIFPKHEDIPVEYLEVMAEAGKEDKASRARKAPAKAPKRKPQKEAKKKVMGSVPESKPED